VDNVRSAGRTARTALPGEDTAADVVTSLFRAHGLDLIRIAVLLTGDQGTAEDIVQDAFLGLHRAMPRLRDDGRIAGYLRVSVVNGCRSALRARRRALLVRLEPDPPAWSAESAVMADEDRRAVLAALGRLPLRTREVIVLRYFLDLPHEKIASTLGISRGTVSSTISRALERLGRDLQDSL
jgi:RNA polymerase sigma-70 factor (sigma-E family)